MVKFIQNRILKPQMATHFRHARGSKSFVTLPEARLIGILADVRTPGSLPHIVNFARSIHKPERKCHILLLVPAKRKEITPFDYEKNFPGMPVEIICQDEMSFFKVPKKELTLPFTSARFDILFYLEVMDNFSLESVLYHSHSKMYAGAAGLCSGVFDFEIELNDRAELSFLTENLHKYLQDRGSKSENKPADQDGLSLF
jgi:hypothetical protein